MPADPSPSYESIAAKLNKHAGTNPTPKQILYAILYLSKAETDVLTEKAAKAPPLTKEQTEAFFRGAGEALASPEADVHLKAATEDVTEAFSYPIFHSRGWVITLEDFDPMNAGGRFPSRLQAMVDSIKSSLIESRELAAGFAIHIQDFSALCKDPLNTSERKLGALLDFNGRSTVLQARAEGMEGNFNKLKTDIATFTDSLQTWVERKTEGDKYSDEAIKEYRKTISRMGETLAWALSAPEIGDTADAPSGSLVGTYFGHFGAFVAISGFNATKVEVPALTEFYIRLNQEIDQPRLATTSLHPIGIVRSIIKILSVFCTHIQRNTGLISDWFTNGAKAADTPDILKESEIAGKMYTRMVAQLFEYPPDGWDVLHL